MTHAVLVALTLLGQAAKAAPGTPRDEPAERLGVMQEAVKAYTITRANGDASPIDVQTEPAFRLGRQGVGNILEGAIFLWADPVGRPEAAAQVFLLRPEDKGEPFWIHEFTSLSTGGLVAVERGVRRWAPDRPGLTFRRAPDAPKPAASSAGRLRQMRSLAAEYRATDDFGGRGWRTLRLLPTPIARYGKAGATPEDGGLFAFVEGTDPEVFLFLEVRRGANGPEWQVAFAPMSVFALKAERNGQVVWELPHRNSESPSGPFYDRVLNP